MTTTWYGGTDTSYAENGGVPLRGIHSGVWADRAKTAPLTGIRDSGGSPATDVISDPVTGHYDFGVDDFEDTVYLDFGAGPYAVEPRDLGTKLGDLKEALTTLQATVAALVASPTAVSFSSLVDWAPLTPFTAGTWQRQPDKSLRIVTSDYTSLAAYGLTDTNNSRKVLDPFYTISEAAAAFAPISQLAELVLYAADDLDDAFNPNVNGSEQQTGGTATSLLVELDEPSDGVTKVGVYLYHPGGSLRCAGVLVVPAGAITPAAPLLLGGTNLSVTTVSGSPVVTAAGVTAAHAGLPLQSTGGIPADCFIGPAPVPGTSFRISADPLTQVDVPATASGSIVVPVAPALTWLPHDRWVSYVLQDSETVYGGSGIKVRIGVGSGSFTVPAAPLAATAFTVTTTSTTATLNWTKGVGATEHEVWKNGRPIARGFNLSSYVYTWAVGETGADFKVLSRVPGATGPFTATITATPSTVWKLLPQAAAGVWDNTKFATTVGTSPTAPSATVDAASGGHQLAHIRSGLATDTSITNNPQDRAIVKAIVDSTNRRAWGFRALLTPINAAALLEVYLGATGGTFTPTGSLTDFLRSTIQQNGCTLEGKAATYDPTSEGNGTTVGSFQRFTDTSYATNILTGASRVSGGVIPFGTAFTPGTYRGIKIVADLVAAGRQVVTVYYGDETQYGTDGSGLPVLFSANLTSRFVTARQAGQFYLQQLGKQTSPTAVEGWDFKDYVDIIPIGA